MLHSATLKIDSFNDLIGADDDGFSQFTETVAIPCQEVLMMTVSIDRTSGVDCFFIDDSLYERVGYKRTKLASRVFDHVSIRYKAGFRLLTLGWTDSCTFLPINFSLLALSDNENGFGPRKKIDKQTIVEKRRRQSRYLLSVPVKVVQDKNGENGIDALIVYVRNRNNRKD